MNSQSFLRIHFLLFVFLFSCSRSGNEIQRSIRYDKEIDGLKGNVKRVVWYQQYENTQSNGEREGRAKTHWKTYEYDKQGRRTAVHHNGKRSVHLFDLNGRLVEIKMEDAAGHVSSSFRVRYDAKGHRIGEEYRDGDGRLIRKWTYQYNPADRTDFVEVSVTDGTVTGCAVWGYDSRGNDIYRAAADTEDIVWSEIFQEFDDNNRLRCYEDRRVYEDGSADMTVRRYEENNKPISVHTVNQEGLVGRQTYEYDCDEEGNWTVQKIIIFSSEADPPRRREVERVYREIEYYE